MYLGASYYHTHVLLSPFYIIAVKHCFACGALNKGLIKCTSHFFSVAIQVYALTMCEYGMPEYSGTTILKVAYCGTAHQGFHAFKEESVSCADLGEPGLVAKT